jgi:hypothetical protein
VIEALEPHLELEGIAMWLSSRRVSSAWRAFSITAITCSRPPSQAAQHHGFHGESLHHEEQGVEDFVVKFPKGVEMLPGAVDGFIESELLRTLAGDWSHGCRTGGGFSGGDPSEPGRGGDHGDQGERDDRPGQELHRLKIRVVGR